MAETSPGPSVSVIVPIYRETLQPEEELSLRHLDEFLPDYQRIFLAPESLRPRRAGYETVHFPDHFFSGVDSYSRLLLSLPFYRAFKAYEYILICQLDSLVFSDQLAEWCQAGYDYVGAPWLLDPDQPERGFSRVGNGGFSLRRVKACLRVLEANGSTDDEELFAPWLRLLRTPLPDLGPLDVAKRLRVVREAARGASWYARHYTLNEDRFWSDRARLFDPGFCIAPPSVAVGFSFERAPRYCFERNGHHLPFGCHAWERWDKGFWEPHLLRQRGAA